MLVFMYTMSVRSPSGVSAPATGSVPLATGRLSPVSADSSTSSVAAFSSRPSAGTISPASIATISPGTSRSAGISASWPSRLTLALMITIFCRAETAAVAFPSWCRPSTRVEKRQQDQQDARAELLERVEAADAGREQHELHRVAVLAEERVPAGLGLASGELVRAEPLGPRGRLGRAETALSIHPFGVQDLIDAERVPRGPAVRGRPSRSRCTRRSRSHMVLQ